MKYVPWRNLALMTALARIVIAETIDQSIPDWGEHLNEKGFTQRYPNVVNHKVAAKEIGSVQILRMSNRIGMLSQTVVKHCACRNIKSKPTLACARRSAFPT